MPATLASIPPADVHAAVAKHLLVDAFDFVFDCEKSHGAWLHDARSGRDLLDFLTFIASSPIGYNHPKTKNKDYLDRLLVAAQVKPSLSDALNVEYASFLQTFSRTAMPSYLPHAFFVEGGTLAVENTLKVAMDYKVRQNWRAGTPKSQERGHAILHLKEAFHGRSGYCLSLTNTDPAKTDLFPKFPWPRVSNPKMRFPQTEDNVRDQRAREEQSLGEVRAAFGRLGDDIAAIILEPIQGEGGDNHFSAEYIQALKRISDENNCLFIVDEVQTGVGMTGKFWAHEHFGIEPDALAFGKKTQTCGILAGGKVDREPDNVFKTKSRINSTWGGGFVDMIRLQRFLEIIEEDRLVDNARVVGEHLLTGLRALETELSPLVTNSRGRGLLVAFDTDASRRSQLLRACFDGGLLCLPCGSTSVRFRPPLTLTKNEADRGLAILRQALKTI